MLRYYFAIRALLRRHRSDTDGEARVPELTSMETTQIYLHANLELKEQALAKTKPFRGQSGRYRPPEQLLAFLQAL